MECLIFYIILSTDSGKDKDKRGWNEHNKEIFIGKKPLMVYVTSTLIQLANQPTVTIKARGLSMGRAVDVSQIILRRMENIGYAISDVKIGSETVQSEDGRTRNVSSIGIEIKRV